MKFETKYNVGDKVWFRCNNIELYIKEHPYKEPQQILESCFHEGYVYKIKVEIGGILDNKSLISYLISNKRLNKGDDPEYEALRKWILIFNLLLNFRCYINNDEFLLR